MKKLTRLVDINAKNLAVLIDPDKLEGSPNLLTRIKLINELKIDFIFVGGSTGSQHQTNNCIEFIKEHSKVPVVLFPGSAQQISEKADGLLLLNLISGRNPEYLIGQHVLAAPSLIKTELEIISTSYILIDGGKQSSVAYVSQTTPIPQNQINIAVNTAIAGQMIGHKIVFYDAGSGALNSVSKELIYETRKQTNQPIIVGGGIVEIEQAKKLFLAGVNTLVIGNKLEEGTDFLFDLWSLKQEMDSINR